MERSTQEKPVSEDKAQEGKNPLGFNKWIYAAGQSSWDALVTGVAVTVASLAVLKFGRREENLAKGIKGNFVDTIAKKLESGHREWETFKQNKLHFKGPLLAVSLIVGWVVSHIVLGLSAHKGLKKGEQILKNYEDLVKERDQLASGGGNQEQVTVLQEENVRLRSELEKRGNIPYTERVSTPPVPAGVTNGL